MATSLFLLIPVLMFTHLRLGAGKDYPEVWGAPLNDIFAREEYSPEHELSAAIKKTGHDIKDVKMVVMGHLHLDHAG